MEEEEAIIKGIETNETRYLYKAETGYMNIIQTSDHDSDFFHKKPSSTNIGRSDKAKTDSEANQFLLNTLTPLNYVLPDSKGFSSSNIDRRNQLLDDFENNLKKSGNAWQDWKFSVQMAMAISKDNDDNQKEEIVERFVNVEIGLIHAAIIKRDIKQVKILTDLASDNLDKLLSTKIECNCPEGYKFTQQCSWISNATAIHLATSWHIKSLVHFLNMRPNLSKQETEKQKVTPLHVAAAIDDNWGAIPSSLLMQKGADVEAENSKGQTALHIAARCGSIKNVMILLFDGKANPMVQDEDKKTPLHYASTDEILDILLNKANLQELTKLDGDNCLFNLILTKRPKCIETYLDLMVKSDNEDADIKEKKYTFDLEIFNHGTDKKSNFLNKHKKLIDTGYSEFLRHPVMMFFASMKWKPHRKKYIANFCVFLVFLLGLTFHGFNAIDYFQLSGKCHNIDRQLWTNDLTNLNQIKSRENSWNKIQEFNLIFDQTIKKLKSGTNIMEIIGTSIKPVGQHSTNSNSQNGKSKDDKSKDDNTQLWKKGPTKQFLKNGKAGNEYFTITNLYNQKVLTAVEGPPASLEIKELIEGDPDCNETWGVWWYISGYVAMGGLGLLALWEIMQFVGKVVTCEIKEYFVSGQNMVDLLMISLSAAFFFLERIEHCPLHDGSEKTLGSIENITNPAVHLQKSGAQEHLLGWTLFLAWINLTLFLGRFDIFGVHIYRSFHVIKNVAWSMSVYLPSLGAFAIAFHCFLRNDDIFEGPFASILKTLAMVLGEFNVEGRFLYDPVAKNNGSQFSVQLLFIMFIIYGSVIVMNLITAWIVVNQQDADSQIILAKSRIEEIIGSTEITFFLKKSKEVGPSALSVVPTEDSSDSCFITLLRRFYRSLMKGQFSQQLLNSPVFWVINSTKEEEKNLLSYVPLEIIDLTLVRLDAKKEKRSELKNRITAVQKETQEKVEKLLKANSGKIEKRFTM